MTLDEAIKITKKELSSLSARLKKKGVPIEDIDIDLDDIDICEPFIHLRLNLDNDWFYEEIERSSK